MINVIYRNCLSLLLIFIVISPPAIGQIIIRKNITEVRFEAMARHAAISDSIGQIISLDSIYSDIVNGKSLLISEHATDSLSFICLNSSSPQISELIIQHLDEIKKMNKDIEGKMLADFEYMAWDGSIHKLSELAGKIIVLNFWFVACKPCREEIPELSKLAEEFKGQDVVFISFARDKRPELEVFLKNSPLNYEIVPDARAAAAKNNIMLYPTNMVLNKDREVIYYGNTIGSLSRKKISRLIRRNL